MALRWGLAKQPRFYQPLISNTKPNNIALNSQHTSDVKRVSTPFHCGSIFSRFETPCTVLYKTTRNTSSNLPETVLVKIMDVNLPYQPPDQGNNDVFHWQCQFQWNYWDPSLLDPDVLALSYALRRNNYGPTFRLSVFSHAEGFPHNHVYRKLQGDVFEIHTSRPACGKLDKFIPFYEYYTSCQRRYTACNGYAIFQL